MKDNLNVILIGIDTLRADHLGAYGYDRPTSPVIDEFARDNTLFTKCFSQAPITAPSFMSIMTGLYPSYHGVIDNIGGTGKNVARAYIADPSIPTIAETLKNAGYETAAFTNGGNVSDILGFGKGFDYYSVKMAIADRQIQSIRQDEIFYWLGEMRHNPFFLFLHTYAVHHPWLTPDKYQEQFPSGYARKADIDLFRENIKNILDIEQTLQSYDEFFKYKKKTRRYFHLHKYFKKNGSEAIEYLMALYDGAIKYVDDFMAGLLNRLEQLKLTENTIIIFTSDHGEEFMEHGRLQHQQLYNELLHVPLIISAPHLKSPEVVNRLVRSIDIFPTILILLDINPEFQLHGVSLLSKTGSGDDLPALAETESHGQAIQNKDTKYIYPRHKHSKIREDELYDLSHDPKELENLFKKRKQRALEMRFKFQDEIRRIPYTKPRNKIIYLSENE